MTRDGRDVRIICTDRNDTFHKVVAVISDGTDHESIYEFTKDGRYVADGLDSRHDLFFRESKKRQGWINIRTTLDDSRMADLVFDTREDAEALSGVNEVTVRIEWEE